MEITIEEIKILIKYWTELRNKTNITVYRNEVMAMETRILYLTDQLKKSLS